MTEAGIDTNIFKSHSTRGASASHMIDSGVPLAEVLKQGAWTDECTFCKFYLRDIPAKV